MRWKGVYNSCLNRNVCVHEQKIYFKMIKFSVGFEGDERTQYLAAKSERDRDKWIAALHIASYECMQMQLESLREQIKSKTGKDPLVHADSHNSPPVTEGNTSIIS